MGYDTPVKSQDPTSISLLGINIRNPDNTVPSTGFVLTVSSGAAYMLPVTAALDSISSLSNLSGQLFALTSNLSSLSSYVNTITPGDVSMWAAYPAICTINAAGFALSSVSSVFVQQNLTVGTASTYAIGINAVAMGPSTVALGDYSMAFGYGNVAAGTSAVALGSGALATGTYSYAEGWNTSSIGFASHSEGSRTIANGNFSHAEGINTQSFGENSHVEGSYTLAYGSNSHAEGYNTEAFGIVSHTEGFRTSALGTACHAEGFSNVAFGSNSHVGGWSCSSIGVASYAHGASNTAASSFSGVLAGYCNITNAICATAVGQFVNARNINALTFAGAAHSTSSAVYLGGTVQTFMTTLAGVMPTTNTEVPMSLFSDTANTTSSNISINILNGSNYFCHTVALDLTGYEKVPGTGTAGNGIFAGTYKFLVYWDNAASSVAYIADRGGVKATSGGSVTLTASDVTNMLSNGTATVTVRAYMTSNVSSTNYSITAQSTGYPLNWLAQVRVGELMSAK